MIIKDPAGHDLLDHLRELFELNADHPVSRRILTAIHKIADDYQDGAPDAGSVARACTWIASLAEDELRSL